MKGQLIHFGLFDHEGDLTFTFNSLESASLSSKQEDGNRARCQPHICFEFSDLCL